jgi:phosphatidylinositol alpha-1,6-mannosyltransferase
LLLGACGDQELEGAYDAADLCVFPLVEMPGDIEGFGMVAIEAAAHGLPTVAFNVGGVGDAIADHRSGRLVPAGSYSNFIEHVIEVLNVGRTRAVQDECRRFAESFEWGHFGDRLRGQVGRLMGGRDSEFPA